MPDPPARVMRDPACGAGGGRGARARSGGSVLEGGWAAGDGEGARPGPGGPDRAPFRAGSRLVYVRGYVQVTLDGALLAPLAVKPTVTVPPAGMLPFDGVLTTVTPVPDWVNVPFHR